MARSKSADEHEHEQIEVMSEEDHEIELPPVNDAARAVLVADATAKKLAEEPDPKLVPVVKRYVVIKGGTILQGGFRTKLTEGKVIDSLNYDIQHLQRQGIRVQREETFAADLVE
jgi:hypothetical protein